MRAKVITTEESILMRDCIIKILHDKSEKPTENGYIIGFGWNEDNEHYFTMGMDYLNIIKSFRKTFNRVPKSQLNEAIKNAWDSLPFSKWCYLTDLLSEDVLKVIKNK